MNKIYYSIMAIMGMSIMQLNATDTMKAHYEKISAETSFPKKEITVLLYVAARNDLISFIDRNLMQLMQVGTNAVLNILVHLNTISGRKRITRRFIIYKNKMVQVGEDEELDSGSPETLIRACTWAFTKFPANINILILWNHGTGDLDPAYQRAINPSELYNYNPNTNMIELNRTIGFLDYLTLSNQAELRGICFDDSTRHYLTNHQVGQALRKVCDECLQGKPIDILCCDACLMSGIGFTYSLKPYKQSPVAHYLVNSQDVVLATGYPYTRMFLKPSLAPQAAEKLAKHFVSSFAQAYIPVTKDFTQSAIDLTQLDQLYEAVETIAQLLITGMHDEINRSVRNFILASSKKEACTYFQEPTYKDMHHLFSNMLSNISMISLKNQSESNRFKADLHQALQNGCAAINRVVIANEVGAGLHKASGISIYLPHEGIHHSYPGTDFGRNSSWPLMLKTLIHG